MIFGSSDVRGTSECRLSRRAFLMGGAGSIGVTVARPAQTSARQVEGSPVASPAATPASLRWHGQTIRVGGWGGEVQTALRSAIFEPFAAATGCDVLEVFTDYGRLETRQPYADAVIVDPIWAATALADGTIEPIPDDAVDRTLFAPNAPLPGAVPAYAYALVGAHRRDAVSRGGAPADWAAWWDTVRFAARRALPRRALGAFEFALLADGVPPGDLYPIDVERAIVSLERIRDAVEDRWWDDGLQPVAWLSRNRADFAVAWHYRVIAGQQDGRDVDFGWNQGLLIADHWVVPRGARGQDVALDFVRFATAPETQAALARAIPLGPVTPAAFGQMNPVGARQLPTAPENVEQMLPIDAGWWAANGIDADERFEEWLTGAQADE